MESINKLDLSVLPIGKTIRGEVAVTSAQRKTARNGSYAVVTFTDGKNTIEGKRWQYDGELPKLGSVLFIIATVDEYRGTKSLNVQRWREGVLDPTAFEAESPVPVQWLKDKFELWISRIDDPDYKAIVQALYEPVLDLWMTKPAAKGIHHNYKGGLLQHTVETVEVAWKQYVAMQDISEMEVDRDLLIAGALLHDVGKLSGYEMIGGAIDLSTAGKFMEHIVLGTSAIINCRTLFNPHTEEVELKIQKLCHCIAAHHGKLEYGSPVQPVLIEAYLIHMADSISATCTLMSNALENTQEEWTEKVYPLNRSLYHG